MKLMAADVLAILAGEMVTGAGGFATSLRVCVCVCVVNTQGFHVLTIQGFYGGRIYCRMFGNGNWESDWEAWDWESDWEA